METYGWSWNCDCYLGNRTFNQQVTAFNWLEPHTIGFVVTDIVNVGYCCSVWKFCYDNVLWHVDFFVTIRWNVTVVNATPRVVRHFVDIEYACAAVNVLVIDRCVTYVARSCRISWTRMVVVRCWRCIVARRWSVMVLWRWSVMVLWRWSVVVLWRWSVVTVGVTARGVTDRIATSAHWSAVNR